MRTETDADPRGEIYAVLFLGLLYVVLVVLRAPILAMGLDLAHQPRTYIADHAVLLEMGNVLIRLPAFVGVITLVRASPRGALYEALHGTRHRVLGVSMAVACVLTIILNATDLWPFDWRFPTNGFLSYLDVLIERREGFALVLLGIWSVLMVPIIEEVVFRYGVVQWILRLRNSASLAVVVSSFLFAFLHLGPGAVWDPAPGTVIKAAWLFAFSIVLSSMCIRKLRRLTTCIVVHATYNALALGVALISLTVPV